MTVDRIRVWAGRTFNHPYEQFSNFRCGLELSGPMPEGEIVEAEVKGLQAKAEGLADEHKQAILDSLRVLRHASQSEARIRTLEQEILRAQEALERLKREASSVVVQPALPLRVRVEEVDE